MSNKTEKIYVGNGVEKFDGGLVEFSVNLTKLKSQAGEHIFPGTDGDKYIKLKVVKKREADQYGKTHYVEVDTFKPESKKVEPVVDDLPF